MFSLTFFELYLEFPRRKKRKSLISRLFAPLDHWERAPIVVYDSFNEKINNTAHTMHYKAYKMQYKKNKFLLLIYRANISGRTKVKGKVGNRWMWTDVDYTWEHQNRQRKMQPYLSQYLQNMQNMQDMQDMQYSQCSQEWSNWYCKACDVMMFSTKQVRVHYYGRRHQKVLKHSLLRTAEVSNVKYEGQESDFDPRKSFKSPTVLKSELEFEILPFDRGNILETGKGKLLKGRQKRKFRPYDSTIYITPMGEYYCKLCKCMGQDQAQFQQHLDSRRHRLQVDSRIHRFKVGSRKHRFKVDSRKHKLKVGSTIRKADEQTDPHFSITSTNSLSNHSSIDVWCPVNLSSFIKQEETSIEDSPRV